MTLVSIITIAKNNEVGLLKTYSSIIAQTVSNWEMIIVVAPSVDRTRELADSISLGNDHVRVISQESQGIFAAMNEGIEDAKGDYLWFMNSGDSFQNSNSLSLALESIEGSEIGIVVGGYQISYADRVIKYELRERYMSPMSFAFTRRGGCHQSMLFRTSVLKERGGYNLKYKVNSDFELVLSIIRFDRGLWVKHIFADVEPGGTADQNLGTVHKEKHEIRKTFFDNKLLEAFSLAWMYAAKLKVFLRSILGT